MQNKSREHDRCSIYYLVYCHNLIWRTCIKQILWSTEVTIIFYSSHLFFSGSNGKLVVVGSGAIFSDQYIDKEDNHKIKEVIFDFLTNSDEGSSSSEAPSTGIKLNEIDAEDPEISDYNMIPDTCRLANAVRVCLQVRR